MRAALSGRLLDVTQCAIQLVVVNGFQEAWIVGVAGDCAFWQDQQFIWLRLFEDSANVTHILRNSQADRKLRCYGGNMQRILISSLCEATPHERL
jgi:hypothetical protein